MPNIEALARAQNDPHLNSARNGITGSREQTPRSIRLPYELWSEVKAAAAVLQNVFPERYVTVNSTLEFLVREGLRSLNKDITPNP